MKSIVKKRRTISILTTMALVFTLLGASAFAAPDTAGHWAENIIAKWLDAGKISGYEDGTFRPDGQMTRAEYATLLSNLIKDREIGEPSTHGFADVKQDDWFYSSVMKLMNMGILAEGQTFRPDDYITRQDAMTMAGKAFHIRGFDTSAIEVFDDYADIAEYAASYVAGFVENGYVVGYEDNTIRPQSLITRAECVKMLDGLDLVHEKNSLKGIIDQIYEAVTGPLPDTRFEEITADNVEYFLGLKDLDDIEEAVASDAMMSAVAHSVCLVRAKEGADIEALKEEISQSVNPYKWICTGVEPENVLVANQGNLILLAMNNTMAQEIVDCFLALDLTASQQPPIEPDESGLYYVDGYYMDDIGTLRPNSVENFAKKVETLSEAYLQNSTGIYYSIIPSKSYFVNDKLQTPFDYDTMLNLLAANIQSATYIDLFSTLKLEDYYKTDPHWKQECLQGVVDQLGNSLGFQINISNNQAHFVEGFIGQHGYHKAGIPGEQLTYFTNDSIDHAYVYNYENPEFHQVYELDKLNTKAPYDMFLSGPSPLMTITNEQASTNKELIVFRDSFACSLAPLLIENYRSITLIDLRYVLSNMLGEYVNFDGKDVLFLYNEQVVNYSEMLK